MEPEVSLPCAQQPHICPHPEPDQSTPRQTTLLIECTKYQKRHEESKTNSMLHNGLLDLMNRSTRFRHYYAHRQELATIQMVSEYGSSPWLWQVAGLVHGCRFERPGRGMLHVQHPSTSNLP